MQTMIAVGVRVDVGGSRGAVCYIGPVDGYEGTWVGVDWDNPGRGKHDGSIKGKQYFQARLVTESWFEKVPVAWHRSKF